MPIITLTSDMGWKDFYVASVKGAIIQQLPEAQIVDISHDIRPFDISQAAFVLRNAFRYFPAGSVHVIGVDSETRAGEPHLAMHADGHFFLGADNGIFNLLFDSEPEKVVEINIQQESNYHTFAMRDVLAKAACYLAHGSSIEFLGRKTDDFKRVMPPMPTSSSDHVMGIINYIDAYGNAFVNITENLFRQVGKGRPFTILFGSDKYSIQKISSRYSDVPEGEKLALFASTGHLQLAINRGTVGAGGGARQLFGLKLHQTVRIDFHDH